MLPNTTGECLRKGTFISNAEMKWIQMILKVTAYSIEHLMPKRKRLKTYPFASDAHERAFKHCFSLVKCRAVIMDDDGKRIMSITPKNFVEFYTAMDSHGLANADRLRAFVRSKENDYGESGWFEFRR
jgi:hypothetical protein